MRGNSGPAGPGDDQLQPHTGGGCVFVSANLLVLHRRKSRRPDQSFTPCFGNTAQRPHQMGNSTLDDYNFFRDLLETWRLTSDWVKTVLLISIPAYTAFLIHQVLHYRNEQKAIIAEQRTSDTDLRPMVEALMREIAAEWERKKFDDDAQPQPGDGTHRRWPV